MGTPVSGLQGFQTAVELQLYDGSQLGAEICITSEARRHHHVRQQSKEQETRSGTRKSSGMRRD